MRKVAFLSKILAALLSMFKYVPELNHWLLQYPFVGALAIIFRLLAIITSFYSNTRQEQRTKHTSCNQSPAIGRPILNKQGKSPTHRSLKRPKRSLKIIRYRPLPPQLNQKLKPGDTVCIIIIYTI